MAIRLRPGSRKAVCYSGFAFVVYWLCIRNRSVSDKFEVTLEADPKSVWEFWADFSNFQKINPTILEFEIDYERGTYENWEYGVTYLEVLTLLPINVRMKGKYRVTPEQKKGHFTEPFRITSQSEACVFGFFCSHSDADMTFTAAGKGQGTKVVESVSLSCPWVFSWYHQAEFQTQRKLMSDALANIDFNVARK